MTLQGTPDPAVTNANIVIGIFLGPPFKWKWNRGAVTFFSIDPTGWVANVAHGLGYRILDTFGHIQTVTVAGTSGATQPSWPATIGTNTTDGSITWVSSLGSDYVQSVSDFGFIEQAVVQEVSATAKPFFQIPATTELLGSDAGSGRFNSIAPYLDDNNGNITFRFTPGVPNVFSQVTVTYQKRMALLVNTTDIWPIPDMYNYVFQQGFLGMSWLFADDPRAFQMLQRFAASLIAVSEGLTEQEKSTFMAEWDIFISSNRSAAKAQQGLSARTL